MKISLTNSTLDDGRALLRCDVSIEITEGAMVCVRSVGLYRSPGGVTFLGWPRTRRGSDFLDALVFKGPLVSTLQDEVLERMRVTYRALAANGSVRPIRDWSLAFSRCGCRS